MPTITRRALLLGSLPVWFALPAASSERPVVLVQPLGGAAALTKPVAESLAAFFDVRVIVARSIALPKRAFYRPRQRYRADVLLEELDNGAPANAARVLGLASVDISTSKPPHEDWGVLGLASLGGRVCVLSSFRCARRARSRAHAIERLAKTAVHELGHTFGLEHCPSRGCLMADAEGSVLTTDTEHDLCSTCRGRLTASGYLRKDALSPWAELVVNP